VNEHARDHLEYFDKFHDLVNFDVDLGKFRLGSLDEQGGWWTRVGTSSDLTDSRAVLDSRGRHRTRFGDSEIGEIENDVIGGFEIGYPTTGCADHRSGSRWLPKHVHAPIVETSETGETGEIVEIVEINEIHEICGRSKQKRWAGQRRNRGVSRPRDQSDDLKGWNDSTVGKEDVEEEGHAVFEHSESFERFAFGQWQCEDETDLELCSHHGGKLRDRFDNLVKKAE
jgi:hypothetical protein